MMGAPMAAAPMTMQSGQMAYRPMVPMTGMTAPFNANQPMNVCAFLFKFFTCILALFDNFPFPFQTANNGYRNQATNDDWSSARRTICDGIYGAAGYAHSSCCKSAIGPIRCPLNQKTEG